MAGALQSINNVFANNTFIMQRLLPFLLAFAVVYGILDSVSPFSDDSNSNEVVALAIALFVAFQGHILFNFMSSYLPGISIGVVGLLGLVILLGIAGVEIDGDGGGGQWKYLLVAIAGLYVWGEFAGTRGGFVDTFIGAPGGITDEFFRAIGGASNLLGYIIVAGLVFMVWHVTRSDSSSN